MKKRLLSVFLALCMCLTLLPTTAWAADVDVGTEEALRAAVARGDSVKLTDNITLTRTLSIIQKTVTLDLNGKTLTGPSGDAAIQVGAPDIVGHLTLKDSGTNGTVTGGSQAISVSGGSLTLESGTVSCTSSDSFGYAIAIYNGTTVTLKGGTVTANNSNTWAIVLESHARLNADGGTVYGHVQNVRSTITHSNGVTTATTFRNATSPNGTVQNSTVKNGGTIEWGTFNCAVENGYSDGDNDIPGTITGGTFQVRVTNNKAGVIGEESGAYNRNSKISFPSGDYSNTLTNYGTIYSGTFQQGGTGNPHTINKNGGTIYGGSFSKLVNEAGGIITLNYSGTGFGTNGVDIGNLSNEDGGTVNISTNTDLGSGSNAGAITVASGKILTLNGSMTNSGSITNHGTITNSSGTFTNSGFLTNDGRFSIKHAVLNSGTFTNYSETDGSTTGGSVSCTNYTFTNTGTFNISKLSSGTAYGSFSGTLENSGTFTYVKNTAAGAGQVPGLESVTNTFMPDSTSDNPATDCDRYRTVSFDLNLSEGTSSDYVPSTQFVPDGETAVKPSPAPTSTDGKTVLFWYENLETFDIPPFDFSTALTRPVSLRAYWGDAPSELTYTTTVRQGGSTTPPAMTFALEFFDAQNNILPTFSSGNYFIDGYETGTAAGQTSVTENLKIALLGTQSGGAAVASCDPNGDSEAAASFADGVFVRQTFTGSDTAGWSSGGEVYFIALEDGVLVVRPATESSEMNPDGTKKVTQYRPGESPLGANETMTFSNTYTAGSSGGGGTTRYTIKSSADTGGSISPVGNVSVRQNDDKTFTITPDTGCVIDDVLVDGKSVGAVSSYTFESVRANHTIEARFTSASAPALPIIPGDLNSTDHTAYVQGFTDGLVRPNAPITRAQTAVMLYRLLTPERRAEIETDVHPFSDMTAQDWYCHEVATMVNGGYISGFSDGTFRGNDPITRAQFVTILTRFIGQLDAECDFTDVPETHWAYTYIATATSAGWISGFADGSFCPDQTITRAQVMAIINRVLNRGVDAESALPAGYKNYPDNPSTAWYYYEVLEATNGHDYTGSRPSEDWTALH